MPEPLFIHLDRPIDDELVQTFVRLGHKMSGYIMKVGSVQDRDAPSRILEEGVRLLSRDAAEPNLQLELEGTPHFTWGIEASYIGSLRRLIRATAQGPEYDA